MTDREKLIKLLKSNQDVLNAAGTSATATLRLADHLIANGVTMQQWIPVAERLPGDWCPVLVVLRDIEKPLIGSYRNNAWFWEKFGTTFVNGAVTHWMPLPEAPKEVE